MCRGISRAFVAALVLSAAALADDAPKRIAAVVSEYRHNSHADVIASRLFQTQTLDGKGARPRMQLVSVFTDQVPANDTSRKWAKEYGFAIHETIEGALTLGTGKLAVDGVLLVAEHGKYPKSDTGQTIYPKRRLFEGIVKVFRDSGRSVPVFCDKHLADNWTDAKWMYDTARELKFPMMAGSSLPMAWRVPAVDIAKGAKLKQLVAVSYHTLDAYGFHALEMVQALAERRQGGETGIKSVQCLVDDAVWKAGEAGVYDRELLAAALARMHDRPVAKDIVLKDHVEEPVLWVIDYADGFRANVLTLNGVVAEFASAWQYADGRSESTLFRLQEARPFMHFAHLVDGIDVLMHTGKSAWPVERTLMSSGVLDALLISKKNGGRRDDTPHLTFSYQVDWTWKDPPPPPPDRPIPEQ